MGAVSFHMLRSLLVLITICFICLKSYGQQEFIRGKSANMLGKNQAIIAMSFGTPLFTGITAQRWELAMSYGISDRLSLSISGSSSNFNTSSFGFETANLNAQYQIWRSGDLQKNLALFAETSLVSDVVDISGGTNFDGNNSGFLVGFVTNQQIENVTLAFSGAFSKISIPRLISGFLSGYGLLYQLSGNIPLIGQGSPLELAVITELLGQYNTEIGEAPAFGFSPRPFRPEGSGLDVLVGLQGTIDNKWRIEMAFQKQVYGDINRTFEIKNLLHLNVKFLLF